jgi:hypothetical protein
MPFLEGDDSFSTCQQLDLSQKPVEVGPAIKPAVGDDGADLLGVADVLEGVGVEQNQVRDFPCSTVPRESSKSRNSAGLRVAVCRACMGVSPASTSSASSSCKLKAGNIGVSNGLIPDCNLIGRDVAQPALVLQSSPGRVDRKKRAP